MYDIEHIEQNNAELLKAAVENGIIDTVQIQAQLDMREKERLLKKHPNKIYQGEDGHWYTYLPDETKKDGRRKIKKDTEEEVNAIVINYYKELEKKESNKYLTLRQVYPMWLRYKEVHTNATSSIKRWHADWNKFYLKDSPEIIDKPIIDLTELELDLWIHKLIKKYNMTKKCYYGMSIIIRQALDYCVEQLEILEENPFREVKINTKLFKKQVKKPDETQVFMIDETPKIVWSALENFRKNPNNTAPFAIILEFLTGFRIGEIVALKEKDVNLNVILMHRRETEIFDCSDFDNMKVIDRPVIEDAKTDAGVRDIPLIPQAKKIIDFVIAYNHQRGWYDEGFLFMNKGKRITIRSMRYHLNKYCEENGITPKSFHKARKTYISALIDQRVNINTIRQAVGHVDERTTYANYCFNRRNPKETYEQFECALIENNGLENCLPVNF